MLLDKPALADFDLSTPEGLRAARLSLKRLSAADALRCVDENERAAGGALMTRGMDGVRTVDKEKRTVHVSFSSEEPVERWFGIEILSHDRGAVDMSFLRSGNAPALWMHDPREMIGVLQDPTHSHSEKRCDCDIRFADDDEGNFYLNRTNGGIIKNTSVGYRILEWERTDDPDDDDALPTYRATKWAPHEVSLVSVPADRTVGVGRSRALVVRCPDTKSIPTPPSQKSSPTMDPVLTAEQIAANAQRTTDAVNAERSRVSSLHSLRRRYDPAGTLVTDAEFDGFVNDATKGELAFRQFLETKNVTPVRAEAGPSGVVVTRNEGDNDPLPVLHGLRGLVFGQDKMPKHLTARSNALLEASPTVFQPTTGGERRLIVDSSSVRSNRLFGHGSQEQLARAQNAQNLVAGGALVGVQFAPEVIPYLRPEPVLQQAGARILSGISGGPGTIRFPKQAGDIYAQWAAAGVASQAGQLPFGVLDLTPKRLIAQVQIDRQLLLQESFDIEAYVRNSINLQFALSYDLAGLIGNGNGMPLGILNTPNIQKGAVSFSGTASCPQYSDFVSFRTKVLKANAGGLGARSFISSPDSVQNWATVPLAPNGATVFNGVFVLDQDNRVRRENCLETTYLNTLPTGYTNAGFTLPLADVVLYGPFGQYMFIEWAGVEWIYDPYTQAGSDLIVLTARLYVDGGCLQPTAFVTSANAGSVPFSI